MTGIKGTPTKNHPLAGVAFAAAKVFAQVGCLTLFTIVLALIAGLWLDAQMDTKPLFTVLFVLASVPVSLFIIIRLTLSGKNQIQSDSNIKPINHFSEGDHGRE